MIGEGKREMSLAILSSLLLASAALPAADSAAIDARVKEIFRPYPGPTTTQAPWERPLFSTETAELIAHWLRVQPKDEPDALNDGDWFCLCQDFDPKGFRALAQVAGAVRPDIAEVRVRVMLGYGEARDERLIFRKEGAAWKLDDLFADPDFPSGLKQKLRETIAEDEALMRAMHP